jgi:hypothetical protein
VTCGNARKVRQTPALEKAKGAGKIACDAIVGLPVLFRASFRLSCARTSHQQ